jgi:hypothetical protein
MTNSTLRPAGNAPTGAEPLLVSDNARPICFAMRNLHLLVPSVYRNANAVALKCGGRNRHGDPNYRVVWGWEDPILYVSVAREFFYLQRWLAVERFTSEIEWQYDQEKFLREEPGLLEPEPFPRHGEYFTVRQCRWAVPAGGRKVAVFRWPDTIWVENAITNNRLDMARTPGEIRADVAWSFAAEEKQRRQLFHQIEDEHDVRNVRETMAHRMIRNPSLRKDPSFLLSPATARSARKRATS